MTSKYSSLSLSLRPFDLSLSNRPSIGIPIQSLRLIKDGVWSSDLCPARALFSIVSIRMSAPPLIPSPFPSLLPTRLLLPTEIHDWNREQDWSWELLHTLNSLVRVIPSDPSSLYPISILSIKFPFFHNRCALIISLVLVNSPSF